ncbi:type II secretion system minor pseudopilin GspK [Telluria aromaticivorans]|uniref:Type II secretion system protein K n=1 Tax=Telluria aromaticivorans TaxID=2725995 RepID=A0A7Y2K2B7_9BURK|nr:type II secretion system minor pseudopilin GspK [Telluria aromaticivorans]NNG24124.1 type II secretion system minor pseudopilin GspK [Telluria aromaticivorans]
MLQRSGRHQRGVAVVTALLLTTLAISIVASLFWQQQVQVRSMENQRLQLQTQWILRGALDWASLVLRQDAYTSQYTSLDQVWATPLAETRLDQYIERERVEGETFDASLSGNIIDATSRYNLANLAENGQRVAAQEAIFRRLLTQLRLDARLAERIGIFVAQGQQAAVQDPQQPVDPPTGPQLVVPPASGVPIPLLQVDDLLAVQGMTPELLAKLRPFLIVLPSGPTPLNVNTVPAELLAALVPDMSLSQANTLVARRKTAPWNNVEQFKSEARMTSDTVPADAYAIKSDWFLVQSRIRLDRAALNAESLIARKSDVIGGGGTTVIWTRQN